MYAGENDGFFPPGWIEDGHGVTEPKYYWMEALRTCYGGAGDLRLCPMAVNIGSESGAGEYNSGAGATTWTTWGYFTGGWGWVVPGDYGSYGWNSFVCNTPDEIGGKPVNTWENMTPSQRQWKKADVKGAGRIPLLGDHKWLDCWPHHGDEPPDWDGQSWGLFDSQMGRICMNRHDGYVNWVFLDYAVRRVGLKELWKLKWNKLFDSTGGPTKEEWPEWMKGFKEYK
jgi:hypothetical protein